jgi:hypothetical protein
LPLRLCASAPLREVFFNLFQKAKTLLIAHCSLLIAHSSLLNTPTAQAKAFAPYRQTGAFIGAPALPHIC